MTLSDKDLERAFEAMGLPEPGRALVRTIRSSPPARAGNGATNVTGRHPSQKTRQTIQYESRSGEGFACLLYEAAPEVRWFCDQPYKLSVPYEVPGSKRTHIEHTPDFLVIREERGPEGTSVWSITFEEWRMSERLERLALGDSGRWQRRSDGTWTHRPVEAFLADLGLSYRLQVIDQMPPLLARNYDILADHFTEPVTLAPEQRTLALEAVNARPGCTLAELRAQVPSISVDEAYALIAGRQVHTDLGAALLTDHEHVRLYTRPEVAALVKAAPLAVDRGELVIESGARVRWGEQVCEILNVSEQDIFLAIEGRGQAVPRRDFLRWVEEGKVVGLSDGRQDLAGHLIQRDPAAMEVAQTRLKIIEPFVATGTYPISRTHQRWIAQYRQAETLYGSGLVGLVPGWENGGNRTERLGEETEQLAAKVIKEQLLRPDQIAIRKAWSIFKLECQQAGIPAMALSTFHQRYKLIKQADRLRARVGGKAAHGAEMRSAASSPLSVHGDYSYARVHVDHTVLDLMTVDSKTGEGLGRPVLSLAVCARSRRIVGKVLSYGAPSTRTLLLMVRDLVARNGKLPTTVITDHGREFRSTYFQALMAAYKVRLEYRRSGKPRDGGPVEAAFRKFNTDLINNLVGNTQITKNVRQMGPEHRPEARAIWTYAELDALIDDHIAWHNAQVVPVLGASPDDIHRRDAEKAGARAFRGIALTPAFKALTALVPRRTPRAKVSRDGVRVNNLDYWCDAFRQPGVEGSYVDVRYEPFNARIAYARVNKVWHACVAQYRELEGRTDKELIAASVELRARLGKSASPYEIAAHLQRVQAKEADLADEQRRRLRRTREEASREDSVPEVVPATVVGAVLSGPNPQDGPAPHELPADVEDVEDEVLMGYEAPSDEQIAQILSDIATAEVAA